MIHKATNESALVWGFGHQYILQLDRFNDMKAMLGSVFYSYLMMIQGFLIWCLKTKRCLVCNTKEKYFCWSLGNNPL